MEEEKTNAHENASVNDTDSPEKFFDIYQSVNQLPKDYKGQLRATMFPDTLEKMRDVYKIQNSVRLMPHDQNTGGFFVALIRKKNHVVFGGKGNVAQKAEKAQESKIIQEEADVEAIKQLDNEVDEKEALKHASEIVETKELKGDNEEAGDEKEEQKTSGQEKGKEKGGRKKDKDKEKKKEDFAVITEKDWEWIRDYYGLNEEFRNLLIQQSAGDKKVLLISPGIRKILDMDKGKFYSIIIDHHFFNDF